MNKLEFSKLLLIGDYLFLVVLILLATTIKDVDFVAIVCAWIAQLGVSSGAYYWKAKTENRAKIPFKVIESLSEEAQNKIDLTQIITSIIESQ